jgi:adenylate cyclase
MIGPPAPAAAEHSTRTRGQRRWRDPQVWRLASGIVLFTFALTHFLNHALGHVSLEAMETAQAIRTGLWRSWPGTMLLYGAAAVHIALALAKFVRRRTWRMAPWEAAQIALGLAIPLLIASHVAATRLDSSLNGGDDTYNVVLRALWPGAALRQTLLLLIVWLHAMIGFHFWLRLRTWYAAWSPVLLIAAALVPTLAITGWIAGAREAELAFSGPPIPPDMAEQRALLVERVDASVRAAFALVIVLIIAMRLAERLRSGPTITYPDGRRIRATSGATLLEMSRAASVPHASICGGRGRCTTCRVLVLDGVDTLPPPNATEAAALGRIHAPPAVRLACQIRPEHSLTIRPLIPLRDASPAVGRDAYRWGVERRITVMFADLRSFTSLAERLYPYDSVFLLNRYFEVMSEVIERNGGEVDKFLGDGIMALFGLSPAHGAGSRDALLAARDMVKGLDLLNEEFEATLAGQLRMGFGIHMGPAVLGRVGGSAARLTALGDSVNIASRLEGLNKEFGSTLVVSDAALRVSALAIEGAEVREVAVRGRGEMLTVHVVKDLDSLAEVPRPLSAA